MLRGSVNVLIKGRSTSYNILFTYNCAVIIQNHYKYFQYYHIWHIVLYELMLYLSGIFYIYCIIVCYYDLYPTKYFSSNLSPNVVSKFDRYHTVLLSKRNDLIQYSTFAVCPVREEYSHTQPLKSRGREKDVHVNSHDISDDVINNNCFNSSDQSSLHKIDPDIHYLTVNNCPIDTPYYSEQLYRDTFGNNINFSMLHLNIRSVPDHILGFISFLDNSDIELKLIALSETWIKPHHIDYNMTHYSLEQDY